MKAEFIKKWSNFWVFQHNANQLTEAFEKELDALTTQPQPTMSAEEIIDKYFKYNEFDKKRVVEAMEEYRNQPIEFNPPHSAQHEAEVLFNKLGYHKSIQILEYTMLNLKAANVSAVWHEEVLTILKGM